MLDETKTDEELKNGKDERQEDGQVENENEEKTDGVEGNEAEEENEEQDVNSDAWMQSEDDEEEELKFSNRDAAAIRHKYKSKLDKQKEQDQRRIDELEEQVKALQAQRPKTVESLQKPKREDFQNEAEFYEALTDYKLDLRSAEQSTNQSAQLKKQQQQESQQRVKEDVDEHYVRAHSLAQKSNIAPEVYQTADRKVREAVEAIYPEGGDAIVDKLISVVGEGSEKVFYHLGVNPSKLRKFQDALREGGDGLAATAYLGQLQAKLSIPSKRTTNAPPPGEDVAGDVSASDLGERALKEKYDKAHRKQDGQAAFDIKKQAKAKGIDTKSW